MLRVSLKRFPFGHDPQLPHHCVQELLPELSPYLCTVRYTTVHRPRKIIRCSLVFLPHEWTEPISPCQNCSTRNSNGWAIRRHSYNLVIVFAKGFLAGTPRTNISCQGKLMRTGEGCSYSYAQSICYASLSLFAGCERRRCGSA